MKSKYVSDEFINDMIKLLYSYMDAANEAKKVNNYQGVVNNNIRATVVNDIILKAKLKNTAE